MKREFRIQASISNQELARRLQQVLHESREGDRVHQINTGVAAKPLGAQVRPDWSHYSILRKSSKSKRLAWWAEWVVQTAPHVSLYRRLQSVEYSVTVFSDFDGTCSEHIFGVSAKQALPGIVRQRAMLASWEHVVQLGPAPVPISKTDRLTQTQSKHTSDPGG